MGTLVPSCFLIPHVMTRKFIHLVHLYPKQEVYKDVSSQVHMLRQMVKEKDEAIQRQSNLERKIHELEKQGTIKIHKKGDGDISILPSPPSGATQVPGMEGVPGGNHTAVGPNHVPAPPPPPPPPPPPLMNGTGR